VEGGGGRGVMDKVCSVFQVIVKQDLTWPEVPILYCIFNIPVLSYATGTLLYNNTPFD
jgi:hypothetical protein